MFACLTVFVLSLYLAVQFIFAVGSNFSIVVLRIEDRWVEYWTKLKKKKRKKSFSTSLACGFSTTLFAPFIDFKYLAFYCNF